LFLFERVEKSCLIFKTTKVTNINPKAPEPAITVGL